MSGAATITLPGGCWLDGVCYRQAELHQLTGEEESALLEEGAALLPAERTTLLLAYCLTRIGPLSPVTPETVRCLSVGDREALCLHLRRLTLGERLQCVLCCPLPGCGQKLALDLCVSDLLVPPYADSYERYQVALKEDGAAYQVCFHLPTGADQEAAARLALHDPQAGARLLLSRCVEQVTAADAGGDWSSALADQLPAILAELDPQAEITLNVTCPACAHTFAALFDPAAYFFQELAGRLNNLYREVHLLALYYHWSEGEIMRMSARKRQRYLELLAEALSPEGFA